MIRVQISENLPQFKNGSWIEEGRSLAHYCAGQRNAFWGPVETTGEDIIGANGEIAHCRYLLVIVRSRDCRGIKNIMRGGLIAYILDENQAWVWIDSESKCRVGKNLFDYRIAKNLLVMTALPPRTETDVPAAIGWTCTIREINTFNCEVS